MNKIYSSPIRVYLCFGVLILLGIWSYLHIPVALFPNSVKPVVNVNIPFGSMLREDFLNKNGKFIEYEFKTIRTKACTLDKVEGFYKTNWVQYRLEFKWKDEGNICLKEVRQILDTYKNKWPNEIRSGAYAYLNVIGMGFLHGTFHSDKRDAKAIYDLIEPILQPKLSSIVEANNPYIFNPFAKQITIELLPLKMASLKLLPKDIFNRIKEQLATYSSGILNESGTKVSIEVSYDSIGVHDLKEILISKDQNKPIFLKNIANIKLEPVNHQQKNILKINGEASVSIFITPYPGKNIKLMCEKILSAVNETLSFAGIPEDIKFSLSINPAEFIDRAIANVTKEVWVCSLIAVLVLFIFIGSFFGTLTALIEIPTSIILSFIIMKLTNVQINLISLAGLALSVGMNVDASIVVIDSVIKKIKKKNNKKKSYNELVSLVSEAVKDVYIPVITATITSLVVFIPLIFTSDLTNTILGDLAKAVIYSHGISMLIALILVPTIRIHLADKFNYLSENHQIKWLDHVLEKVYMSYISSLDFFLRSNKIRYLSYFILFFLTTFLIWNIPPKLKREIIGKPETSIITSDIIVKKHTHINEMEESVIRFERRIADNFPKKIAFTFVNIYAPTRAFMVIHLEDKNEFKSMIEILQKMTKDDLDIHYHFDSFNPAELPTPNPPDWKVIFKGQNIEKNQIAHDYFRFELLNSGIVDDIEEDTNRVFDNRIVLKPHDEKWNLIRSSGLGIHHSDLADIVTLATKSLEIGSMVIDNRHLTIMAKYPDQMVSTRNDIISLPVPLGNHLIPLRSLVDISSMKQQPEILRINGQRTFKLEGYFSEKEKKNEGNVNNKLKNMVQKFKKQTLPKISDKVMVDLVDAKVELSKAIDELLFTVLISISLIFLVLVVQFNSIIHPLIIILAIPFGILGVLISLYIFNSTISLNSALGIILLVGVTVANSIMLVEMILKLTRSGMNPEKAILETAKKRIRPILMTSLTTILGMLPVAIGHGEGGKVLQPLGIAVCGGLWVSLILTLYIIPALEYSYLRSKIVKTGD